MHASTVLNQVWSTAATVFYICLTRGKPIATKNNFLIHRFYHLYHRFDHLGKARKCTKRKIICGIREVLFFPFFQHFLQQYRRHRIHSFTNTKHTTTTTTTTLVAVAVKKEQRSKLQDVEGLPGDSLDQFSFAGVLKNKIKSNQAALSSLRTAPFVWDALCSNLKESKVPFQTRW